MLHFNIVTDLIFMYLLLLNYFASFILKILNVYICAAILLFDLCDIFVIISMLSAPGERWRAHSWRPHANFSTDRGQDFERTLPLYLVLKEKFYSFCFRHVISSHGTPKVRTILVLNRYFLFWVGEGMGEATEIQIKELFSYHQKPEVVFTAYLMQPLEVIPRLTGRIM